MSSTKKLKLEELGRIDVETFKQTEKIPLVVVLDNVRSMHNVGAVFRTADAFLVEKIILCGITPQPPHREIHKAALGATESVDWIYEKDISTALENLKKENFKILGIEQTTNSEIITDFVIKKNEKYALVLGNEVDGLSDEAPAKSAPISARDVVVGFVLTFLDFISPSSIPNDYFLILSIGF